MDSTATHLLKPIDHLVSWNLIRNNYHAIVQVSLMPLPKQYFSKTWITA